MTMKKAVKKTQTKKTYESKRAELKARIEAVMSDLDMDVLNMPPNDVAGAVQDAVSQLDEIAWDMTQTIEN